MYTAQSKRKGEHSDSFLAGHMAPAGDYREIVTGREIRLEEEDIVPATCDGHVAIYTPQHLTWAEIKMPEKGI